MDGWMGRVSIHSYVKFDGDWEYVNFNIGCHLEKIKLTVTPCMPE